MDKELNATSAPIMDKKGEEILAKDGTPVFASMNPDDENQGTETPTTPETPENPETPEEGQNPSEGGEGATDSDDDTPLNVKIMKKTGLTLNLVDAILARAEASESQDEKNECLAHLIWHMTAGVIMPYEEKKELIQETAEEIGADVPEAWSTVEIETQP